MFSATILSLIDAPGLREETLNQLSENFPGWQISNTASRPELELILQHGSFDLLLGDSDLEWITMPDLFQLVKLYQPACPVVFLIDPQAEPAMAQVLRAGLDDYVIKNPLDRQRLLWVIRAALERADQARALQAAETRYRSLVESIPAVTYIATMNPDDAIQYVSPQIARWGYTREEHQQRADFWLEIIHPEDRPRAAAAYAAALKNITPFRCEYRLFTKDGRTVWVHDEGEPVYNEAGVPAYFQGVMVDITDRKQAEEKALRLGRMYALVSQANEAVVRTHDLHRLFEQVCQVAVEVGRFRLAWVGLVDAETCAVVPVAQAGYAADYLDNINILVNDSPVGHGPTGMAIRQDSPFVCNDIAGDKHMQPWRAAALERGYRASVALPLHRAETVIGALNLYASETDFFDQEELQLLITLADNLSYALTAIEQDAARQRVESALRENEALYRALFETMAQGVVYQDAQGRIIAANPAAERILGLSLAQMQGRTSLDPRWRTVHEDGQPFPGGEHPAMAALHNGQAVFNTLMGVFNPQESSYRWLLVSAVPQFRPGEQHPFQVFATFEDITGRRQAELALEESEHKFRSVIEQSVDGIMLTDERGLIATWNRAMEQITGMAAAEVVGKPVWDLWYGMMAPEDQGRLGFEWVKDTVQTFVRTGQAPWLGEYRETENVFKAGERRLTQSAIFPIHTEKGYLACSIMRDITERTRGQQRLRLLSTALEAAANGIAIVNRQGIIEWVNPAFSRLTGFSADEAVGQNPRIMRSGRQAPEFYHQMWETILAGGVWRGELINRRKDGSLYYEEMTITPVIQAGGRVTHFISIKHDISERKQRQREMEAVTTVSAALRNAQTQAEMMPVLLEQVLALLEADGAILTLRDPASGEGVVEYANGALAHLIGLHIPAGEGVSGYVMATGASLLVPDITADERVYRPELLKDVQVIAAVPLIVQGQTIGALSVGRLTELSETEVRMLAAIADMAANAIQRAAFHEKTEEQLQRISALRAVETAIGATLDLRVTLNVLLEHVTAQLRADAAAVLLLNPYTRRLEFSAGRGFRTSAITRSNPRLGEGLAGKAALDRRPVYAANLAASQIPFTHSPLLVGEGFVSYFSVPLVAKAQVKGVLEIYQRSALNLDSSWVDFLETLAGEAAIAIDNASLFDDLQRSNMQLSLAYDATIEGWSRALDLRDKETEGHTQRVSALTEQLGRAIGLSDAELVHVRRGAMLHDIGKMGVPDSILQKPGPLTDEEWAVMRLHPVYAQAMLQPISYLRQAIDIPYCHHEKWDGSGYPRGLRGDQIPLTARIFTVVDVWDALTSDRPYRPAWTKDAAIEYIQAEAGSHFDPQVVAAFMRLLDDL